MEGSMKGYLNKLGSAKLAIVLFFLLAGISILGTLIPQGQTAGFYLTKYGQALGKLILFFQLNDAYHSWWYIATLFLFLTNLVICSLNRLPFTLKLYSKDPADIHPEKLPNMIKADFEGNPDRLKEIILNKLSFKKAEKNLGKGELYYKSLNKFSFFSVYVVHFSLVIIIIGALIGAFFGYRGNMTILEGESSNIVQPLRQKDPVYLDFSVKLNKFILETYPNGMIKEYISNITIVDHNKTVEAILKVNQPFKYKDVTFYQASYNIIPEFKIKIKLNGKEREETISPFQPLNLEDRYSIALQEYGEAHGLIFMKVWVIEEEKGESREGLVISGLPPLEISFSEDKLSIEFVELGKLYYMTGLQAKRDPGNLIVYLGFIVMILGLVLVYYFDPKIFWIYLKEEEGKYELYLGGYAKRERETLKTKLMELLEDIKQI